MGFPKNSGACRARLGRPAGFVRGGYKGNDPTPSKKVFEPSRDVVTVHNVAAANIVYHSNICGMAPGRAGRRRAAEQPSSRAAEQPSSRAAEQPAPGRPGMGWAPDRAKEQGAGQGDGQGEEQSTRCIYTAPGQPGHWDWTGHYVPPVQFVQQHFEAGQTRTNPAKGSILIRTHHERAWTNAKCRVCPGLDARGKWRKP